MTRHRPRIAAAQRRRQILEVATELFAERGFQGTTTHEIADRAGVNEALVFRHFPRKQDLYWAVIDFKCRAGTGRRRMEELLRTHGDEAERLAAIAAGILRRARADQSLTRLLLFSALENHRLSHRFFRTYMASYYESLADYIRAARRRGRYRHLPPLLAARSFIGMVFYHFLIQELFGGRHYHKFDIDAVARTLADLWLDGMRATPGRRRATAARNGARASKSQREKRRS